MVSWAPAEAPFPGPKLSRTGFDAHCSDPANVRRVADQGNGPNPDWEWVAARLDTDPRTACGNVGQPEGTAHQVGVREPGYRIRNPQKSAPQGAPPPVRVMRDWEP